MGGGLRRLCSLLIVLFSHTGLGGPLSSSDCRGCGGRHKAALIVSMEPAFHPIMADFLPTVFPPSTVVNSTICFRNEKFKKTISSRPFLSRLVHTLGGVRTSGGDGTIKGNGSRRVSEIR